MSEEKDLEQALKCPYCFAGKHCYYDHGPVFIAAINSLRAQNSALEERVALADRLAEAAKEFREHSSDSRTRFYAYRDSLDASLEAYGKAEGSDE